MFLRLVTLIFDLLTLNKWFPGLIAEDVYVKFGEFSCIDF